MTLDNSSIRFRPACRDDVGTILDIWHEGWWDAHGAVAPDALRRHRARSDTAARIPGILGRAAIAEVDGVAAGFVSVDGNEIVNIYVSRPFRGSGLAPKLLAEGERLIAATGARDCLLWCAAGNERAYRFYLRQGWRDDGVHDHGASTPEGPVPLPCHRMVKEIAGTGAG
ncbi:GNAT family N-acetyltransferase [Microbaculum marinum]|uniref:GNAT family N-acetyltransferase n=1 Tax=Microbaculum marinum TaxID=1764581 RepID=A0AAW9RJC4_9HYPH